MLKIVRSNRFEKDIKLAKKRNLDLKELDIVITKLANQEQLEQKYCDHALSNNFKDFRECHSDILPPLKEVGASCSLTLMSQA